MISTENGWEEQAKGRRNRYRSYLKDAILLGLYTGSRLDSIVHLKWKDIEANYVKPPNVKRNTREKTDEHHELIYITSDFASFLAQLPRGDEDEYILAPELERSTVHESITKGFTHFWRLVSSEKKSFTHLRKTHSTRMGILLGDKIKLLKRHASNDTTRRHYMNQAELSKMMEGVVMFDLGIT